MSGSAVMSHDWPQNGKSIICKTDNCVPLVVLGLSVNSGSSSSSTTPSPESLGPQAPPLASGNTAAANSSSDSVLGRSDETSSGKLGAGILGKWQEGQEWSVSRNALLVTEIHRLYDSHRSACTSTHFSGFGFSTFYERGNEVEETSYLHSLPERPKLRRLLEKQHNESLLQKSHWRSFTTSRKVWWLDDGRSQSPSWGMWI